MKALILAAALLAVPFVPASAMPGDPPFINGIATEDCRKLNGYKAIIDWLDDHPNGQDADGYVPKMIALMRAIIAEHPSLTPVEVLRRCNQPNPERTWSLALSYARLQPTSPRRTQCDPDFAGGFDCTSR
jgi:hypothetical protein